MSDDELREATKRSIALLVAQRRGAEGWDEQDLITASNILFVCSRLIKDRDAERETQLLDALYLMYGQYCGHDKWGHKFMGAGETASALLEDAGYIVVDTVGMITKDYGDSREQQLEAIIREDTVLGMPIKTDPKLKSNQIRFDHPDGRSEGFEL